MENNTPLRSPPRTPSFLKALLLQFGAGVSLLVAFPFSVQITRPLDYILHYEVQSETIYYNAVIAICLGIAAAIIPYLVLKAWIRIRWGWFIASALMMVALILGAGQWLLPAFTSLLPDIPTIGSVSNSIYYRAATIHAVLTGLFIGVGGGFLLSLAQSFFLITGRRQWYLAGILIWGPGSALVNGFLGYWLAVYQSQMPF